MKKWWGWIIFVLVIVGLNVASHYFGWGYSFF